MSFSKVGNSGISIFSVHNELINPPCFAKQNATAHAGAEDLASLFCEAKSELYSEERIWPPVL